MHVDTNSHKLKVDKKNSCIDVARNRFGQSGHRTQKLAVSQEWIDGMNWCLHGGANSGK